MSINLHLELAGKNTKVIDLPSSWAELEDARHITQIPHGEPCRIYIFCAEPDHLKEVLPDEVDIDQLQCFMEMLDRMDERQADCLEGSIKFRQFQLHRTQLPLPLLIDLACSVDACTIQYDIYDDADLYQARINAGAPTEILDRLPGKVRKSLSPMELGQLLRLAEDGVFTSKGYVSIPGGTKLAHDKAMLPPRPAKPDWTIHLEFRSGIVQPISLSLPNTPDAVQDVLQQVKYLGPDGYDDIKISSIIPSLNFLSPPILDDLPRLNALAQLIQDADQRGELVKCKAVLALMDDRPVDLSTAEQLLQSLGSYQFYPELTSAADYGRLCARAAYGLKEDDLLSDYIDLTRYGEFLMRTNDVSLTRYGLVRTLTPDPVRSPLVEAETGGPSMQM